jgi:hypothetical protein
MNSSDPFTPIAKELAKYRRSNPHSRRFPLALWQKIIPLTKHYSVSQVATRLQISAANLARKIQKPDGDTKSNSSTLPRLVEVPFPPTRPCIMELEYPNGIKVRLFAQ